MRLNEMAETVTAEIAAGTKVIEIITAPGLGVNAQLKEILENFKTYEIDSVTDRTQDFTSFKRDGETNLISINDNLLNAEVITVTDFEYNDDLEELLESLESDNTVFGTKLPNLKTVVKVSYDFSLAMDEITVM